MNARASILETVSELRARYARHRAFVDSKRSKSGWASYVPDEVPEDARMSNDERSALEVYDWLTAPPARYFVYIDEDKRTATTWMGDVLGRIWLGATYRDNFGGRRRAVTLYGINGKTYYGTYYTSAGQYARVKMAKHQPKPS